MLNIGKLIEKAGKEKPDLTQRKLITKGKE